MGKMVRLPWVNVSLMAMVRDVIANGKITLEIAPRPDVQTRRWYSLGWVGADGKQHSTAASEMQLLLRRAAEIEQAARMNTEDWDDE